MLEDLVTMYDNDDDCVPLGWLEKSIAFVLVLDAHGYVGRIDVLEKPSDNPKSKKMVPDRLKVRFVGRTDRRGINPTPFFLVDNLAFLAGIAKKGGDAAKTAAAHALSVSYHQDAEAAVGDPSYSTVCRFLELGQSAFRKYDCGLDEFLKHSASEGFGTFRVGDDPLLVVERPSVRLWMTQKAESDRAEDAAAMKVRPCLVSGEEKPTATVHRHGIYGLPGGPTTGSNLVGVNLASACSYGAQQADNSPVGLDEAEKYAKMFNKLVSDKTTHFKLNDKLTLVFLEVPRKSGISANIVKAIRGESLAFPADLSTDTQIRVIGATPNAARIFPSFDSGLIPSLTLQSRLEHYAALFAKELPSKEDGTPRYDTSAPVSFFALLRLVLRTDRNYDSIPAKNRGKPIDMNEVDKETLIRLLEVMLVTGTFDPESELYRKLQEGLNDKPYDTIVSDRVAYALGIVDNKAPLHYVLLQRSGVDHDCVQMPYLLGRLACLYCNAQEVYHELQKSICRTGSGRKTPFRDRLGVSGEGVNGVWNEMSAMYYGTYLPWLRRISNEIHKEKWRDARHVDKVRCCIYATELEKLHHRISEKMGSLEPSALLTPTQRAQFRNGFSQQDFEFRKNFAFKTPPAGA